MDEREQQADGSERGEGTPSHPSGQGSTAWYTSGAGTAGADPNIPGDGARSDQARPEYPAGTHQAGWEQPPVGAAHWGAGPATGTDAQGRPTWGDPAGSAAGKKNGSWKKTVGAVAVAAVVVTGGVFGVNAMASGSEGTGASTQRGVGGPGGMGGYGQGGFPGGGMPGADGGQGRQGVGQFGLTAALHGDFVVSSGSSYETRRLQRGTISAIGGGTVSITSADGYSSNYAVGDVDVSSLAVGASVVAVATVSGDTATLTSIVSADAATTGSGRLGGTGGSGTGPQSGTDPQQGVPGGTGTDPQQGVPGGTGTDPQQDGQQAPSTSGTTANA